MSEINLQQSHDLGLAKARQLALDWMDEGARQLGLSCQREEGATQDTITFDRMGVNGRMVVSGEHFDLQVKLGMMMAAFKPLIEAEIAKNLARVVEKASGGSGKTAT